MARVLEVKVEDLGTLGSQSTKYVGISSTCTVFAESEVISQLSMETNKCDIINGIHHSVANRVAGLAHRVGVRDQVVMTGGVAQNIGIVNALQEQLGHTIHTSPLTQYNGRSGRRPVCLSEVSEGAEGMKKVLFGIALILFAILFLMSDIWFRPLVGDVLTQGQFAMLVGVAGLVIAGIGAFTKDK